MVSGSSADEEDDERDKEGPWPFAIGEVMETLCGGEVSGGGLTEG